MLRVLLIGTLIAALILVLHFPSTMSAMEYYGMLTEERAAVAERWGEGQSRRIEALARRIYRASLDPPLPGPLGKEDRVQAANRAAGPSVEELPSKLANNDYADSLKAALSVATYRLAAVLMFMPFFVPFTVAAVVDGVAERRIRSVGFANDSAGLYGLYAGSAVALLCSAFLALAWPNVVPPTLLALVPILIAFLAGRAAANFRQVL